MYVWDSFSMQLLSRFGCRQEIDCTLEENINYFLSPEKEHGFRGIWGKPKFRQYLIEYSILPLHLYSLEVQISAQLNNKSLNTFNILLDFVPIFLSLVVAQDISLSLYLGHCSVSRLQKKKQSLLNPSSMDYQGSIPNGKNEVLMWRLYPSVCLSVLRCATINQFIALQVINN